MPAAAARSLRILCAEDNPYGRVVLNTILTELGNIVDGKKSAKQGLDDAARKVDDLLTTG